MIPMVVTTNQKTAFFEILTPPEALYGVRTVTQHAVAFQKMEETDVGDAVIVDVRRNVIAGDDLHLSVLSAVD